MYTPLRKDNINSLNLVSRFANNCPKMSTFVSLCFLLMTALAQQHGQPGHHPDGSILCLSDRDCSCIESYDSVYCIDNRCECIPELGKRQATAVHSAACDQDKICTCSDGSTGHCSQEGNCHCLTLAEHHGQPGDHPDGSIKCLSDQDCSCIESYDIANCISNRCECISVLGKRQATSAHAEACDQDKICTCSDGSTGHCSQEGNCHCHHR